MPPQCGAVLPTLHFLEAHWYRQGAFVPVELHHQFFFVSAQVDLEVVP